MVAVTDVQVLEITGSMNFQIVKCTVNNATGDYFVSKFQKIKGVTVGGENKLVSCIPNGQVVAIYADAGEPIPCQLSLFIVGS